MKKNSLFLSAIALTTAIGFTAHADFSIDDYNKALPSWGTTWAPGNGAINGYYPSFYTGFAPRTNTAERLHIRTSRGNQTRVTMILDEQTVSDYLFDLAKRYEFYKTATNGRLADPSPGRASLLPQLSSFNKVIESKRYGILNFVAQAKGGAQTPEAIYKKGLEVLGQLNPGRIFNLRLNLTKEFMKWKAQARANANWARAGHFEQKPQDAVIAINSLVWGRVDFTQKPSSDVLRKLTELANLAQIDGNDDQFVAAAVDLFKSVTGMKYAFRVVQNGKFERALQCSSSNNCFLTYSEFTTVYPTGSVKAFTRDQFGNSIPTFATPGLWRFLSRGYHEVDNIRDEPYYGWAPKMDFEAIGNGFHNPAVRFGGLQNSTKNALGIPASHTTLWSVKRGGVSHGCLRLPLGHTWEMRHLMPVENSQMTKVDFFGNDPKDFDVFDIDGNGSPEVMGVEYMISYDLKGTGGLAKREGANLEIGSEGKLKFYQNLYGAKNVFTVDNKGNYSFMNPSVSLPSYLDFQKKKVSTRMTVNGNIPLFEQGYERDKVQLYLPYTTNGLTSKGQSPLSKRIVRLMGRVRGCAPSSDKQTCGEAAFDKEAAGILREIR